jgi:hypothetical protein
MPLSELDCGITGARKMNMKMIIARNSLDLVCIIELIRSPVKN